MPLKRPRAPQIVLGCLEGVALRLAAIVDLLAPFADRSEGEGKGEGGAEGGVQDGIEGGSGCVARAHLAPLVASGAALGSALWRQIIADATGRPVLVGEAFVHAAALSRKHLLSVYYLSTPLAAGWG